MKGRRAIALRGLADHPGRSTCAISVQVQWPSELSGRGLEPKKVTESLGQDFSPIR